MTTFLKIKNDTFVNPALSFSSVACLRCKNNTFNLCHRMDSDDHSRALELNMHCKSCDFFYVGYGTFHLFFTNGDDMNSWVLEFRTLDNKCINNIFKNGINIQTKLPLLPFDITKEKLEQLLMLA